MVLSRRRVLALLAAASPALLPKKLAKGQSDELTPNVLTGVRLEPFVDPLVVPAVLRGSNHNGAPRRHRIRISEFRQKLHRDLPESIVWGFEGSMPGPTIECRRGEPIIIDWVNNLPPKHRLLVDHTLCGAEKHVPEVRTAIHLHGGHVSAANDGYPEDWVTPGQVKRTVYLNQQPAAALWYHDHAMGITRLNAMMGLAGMYLIREPAEDAFRFPSGSRDIPLVLQDRTLDANGQLVYPVADNPAEPAVPEFFGSHIVVNGRISPFLDVEPRTYRLRFLNASNARVFELILDPEQRFIQIGTDGGLLPQPAARTELLIAPGERIDVIADFRGRAGRRFMLVNIARAPYPNGTEAVPGPVMQIRVADSLIDKHDDHVEVPDTLAEIPALREMAAANTRRLKLMEIMPSNGQRHCVLLDGKRFKDQVSEDPVHGTVEVWELVNTTTDAHPIHLHAVHFQLLDHRPFDVHRYEHTSEISFTRKPVEPLPHERGWKDTIVCPPGQVTRIIIPFTAEPGRFVWHCHMLEHEDNEMMRPYVIRS